MLLSLGIVLVAGAFGLATLAKRYLHSDAFRQLLSQRTSRALGVEGEFARLSWSDASVYSQHYRGQGRGPIKDIDAQGIRATVDFGSFKREAWEVNGVSLDRVALAFDLGAGAEPSSPLGGEPDSPAKSFWWRWIPQKVDVSSIEIAELDYRSRGDELSIVGQDLRVTLSPLTGEDAWSLHGYGGSIKLGQMDPLAVDDFQVRLRGGDIFITDAGFKVLGHAMLTTQGDIGFHAGKLVLRSRLDYLRGDRVLRPDWRQRLLGTIHAEFETRGSFQDAVVLSHSGKVHLKNGILMALPVLEKLAEYTGTERFRRLVLAQASADFSLTDNVLEMKEISIRSDGLLQANGRLTVRDPFAKNRSRPISGTFRVGVVRDALKWLPGAEKRVFSEEKSGYLWTTMHIGGMLEAPLEDLSPRLSRAAVAETVQAVPQTALDLGRGLLDTASDVLGPETGGPLENLGDELLDGADAVIREGLRMVPLLGLEPQ